MGTTRALAAIVAVPLLFACATEEPRAVETPAKSGASESGLPRREGSAYYDTPTVAQALRLGDAAVCGSLVEVLPKHRIVSTEETPKVAEERVGLSFKIVEALAGKYIPGNVVTIESVGYEIDAVTGERVAEIALDGQGPSDWEVGNDYCFLIADTEVGLQFRSPELVGRVATGGLLIPIVSPNHAPDGAELATLDGLRRLVEGTNG